MSSRLRTLLAAATLLAATATTAAAADPEWIRQFGTDTVDVANGVAVGPDGRVHVAGESEGSFADVDTPGRDAIVITFDRDGTELWRVQKGSMSYHDIADAVATDADGNVYVVGETSGALGGSHKGATDAFVIKLDRDGRHVWSRQPGTTGYDSASDVATDADGNVYVVGYTSDALGGTHKGANDAFVIKLDRDGRYVWKRQPGTSAEDFATGVATDADGNVYVVGYTSGALGGTGKGNYDVFVLKFDRDGRYLWKRQLGTDKPDRAYGVATDADGNVYVVGGTEVAFRDNDAFVIKFDRAGRPVWKRHPDTTPDYAFDVATDSNSNIYVVGAIWPGSSAITRVIKYDRDGGILWTDEGSERGTVAYGVAADADGSVYVAGYTGWSLPGNTHLGSLDAFLIKYGPDGPQ